MYIHTYIQTYMCCSTRTDVCYAIMPVGRLSVAQAQFVKRWFLSLPDLTWCVFGVTTPSASAICNCESVVAAALYVCIMLLLALPRAARIPRSLPKTVEGCSLPRTATSSSSRSHGAAPM